MNILFITSTRIGDAVLSTGLLDHLLRRYPGARVTVACGPLPAPLFAAIPGVVRVLPMVKRRRAGHWLWLWRQTVATRWSLVVDLRGSALAYLVPAWRRRVIRSDWSPRHRLLHLARLFGLEDAPPAPCLHAPPSAWERAAALIPAGGPVLALGPSANWGGKQWPTDRFVEAARQLTAPGAPLADARIAVFAGPEDRGIAAAFAAAFPPHRMIDLAGALDLPTVHACLSRCAVFIGNDSGLMHIAAASGVPTLGLFGPSSEILYGPWGRWCRSVRGPRGFEDICHAPDFDHRRQDSLMTDLTVDRVVAAAAALWSESRGDETRA